MNPPTPPSAGTGAGGPQRSLRITVHEALIISAQELIADVGLGVSIQALCDRAGVAVGTLYNHFAGKDDLLAAAATAAIKEFQDYLNARGAGITDPVEHFTTDMRLYGRMPDTHPLHARVLARTSPEIIARPHGYNPDSLVFVQKLVDAGKLRCDDIELALMAAFAAFDRLIAIRILDPAVREHRADDLAAMVLTWFGLTKRQARAKVARPLQPLVAV